MARGHATVTGFTSVEWDKLANPLIADFTRKVAEEALIGAVRGGFDNEPVVVTDGVPFRDYADVKPFGKIEFIRRPVMAECARWMLARLIAIAPVGPGRNGHYKDAFVVMVNDAQVEDAALDKVKPTDRVQIVNTKPYARKLEGSRAKGKGSRRRPRKKALSAQAPAGVFTVVYREAVNRYGRSIFIDFRYRELNIGGTVMRHQTHGKKIKRPYAVSALYPTFNLYIKSAFN